MSGYSENVTIDEGIDPDTGVRTQFHFEGDEIIVQKTYDAEPYLRKAQEMRERNEGKSWGEGKEVGVIPPWVYPEIQKLRDRRERSKAIKAFFRANPAFCAYPAYLKR